MATGDADQPGADAPVPGGAGAEQDVRMVAESDVPGIDPRYAAQFQRGFDPDLREPVDGTSARRALTWWDWLLPGVGGGLIVIALMLWWSLATDSAAYFGTTSNDRWASFLEYARYQLAGPLLIAGTVAVTGGAVLQAVDPRR